MEKTLKELYEEKAQELGLEEYGKHIKSYNGCATFVVELVEETKVDPSQVEIKYVEKYESIQIRINEINLESELLKVQNKAIDDAKKEKFQNIAKHYARKFGTDFIENILK